MTDQRPLEKILDVLRADLARLEADQRADGAAYTACQSQLEALRRELRAQAELALTPTLAAKPSGVQGAPAAASPIAQVAPVYPPRSARAAASRPGAPAHIEPADEIPSPESQSANPGLAGFSDVDWGAGAEPDAFSDGEALPIRQDIAAAEDSRTAGQVDGQVTPTGVFLWSLAEVFGEAVDANYADADN